MVLVKQRVSSDIWSPQGSVIAIDFAARTATANRGRPLAFEKMIAENLWPLIGSAGIRPGTGSDAVSLKIPGKDMRRSGSILIEISERSEDQDFACVASFYGDAAHLVMMLRRNGDLELDACLSGLELGSFKVPKALTADRSGRVLFSFDGKHWAASGSGRAMAYTSQHPLKLQPRLWLGSNAGLANKLDGSIRKLAFFPYALRAEQMASMS